MRSKQLAVGRLADLAAGSRPSTLRAVLSTLGPRAPIVTVAPRGLDVAVSGPTIFDRVRPREVSDRIVLAVGVDAAGVEAMALIDAVGQSGAAAVVLLSTSAPGRRAKELATRAGVAVLLAPAELSWDSLHAQLRAAVDATSVSASAHADLSSLADHIHRQLDGPVVVADTALVVLAHSALDDPLLADDAQRSLILGRRFPSGWSRTMRRDGTLSRLLATDEPLLIQGPAGCQERLAASIRIGGEPAGSIWVQRGGRPLDRDAAHKLAGFARAAAPLVLAKQWQSPAAHDDRSQLLLDFVNGRVPVDVLAIALGIDLSSLATVAALSVTGSRMDDGLSADRATQRAISEIALYCRSFRSRAAVARIGDVGYLLIPHPTAPNGRNDAAGFLRSLVGQVESALGHDVIAAIGGTARLQDIRPVFGTADRVLRAGLRQRRRQSVVTKEDVQTRLVLDRLSELCGTDTLLRSTALAVLAQHDRDHGTSYVMTLRAYLDHLGDAAIAAKHLGVHANTVRYRLKRAQAIAGLCLTDPDERFIFELGFRLLAADQPPAAEFDSSMVDASNSFD